MLKDTRGDAVVEATILFPIMIMIFMAIVMLSLYLPQGVVLQNATQYAAEALALERSETGYIFQENGAGGTMDVYWDFDLHNTIFNGLAGTNRSTNNIWYRTFSWFFPHDGEWEARAQTIVNKIVGQSVTMTDAPVTVTITFRKTILYSELAVKAVQEIPIPVDFSFIGFPTKITVEKVSLFTIPDGDTYVRNIDEAFAFSDISVRVDDIFHDITLEGFGAHLKTFLETIIGLN